MGIRDALKRVRTPIEEIDRGHRQLRREATGCSPISDVAARSWARMAGDVQSVRIVPRAGSNSLEITIDDGHGRAVAVFFGRKALPGVNLGRAIVVEGRTMPERGRVVLYNPAYELL